MTPYPSLTSHMGSGSGRTNESLALQIAARAHTSSSNQAPSSSEEDAFPGYPKPPEPTKHPAYQYAPIQRGKVSHKVVKDVGLDPSLQTTPYAQSNMGNAPFRLEEENGLAKRATPYVQPEPSRGGLFSFLGSLFSATSLEGRLTSNTIVRWGKEQYPTKRDFVTQAQVYYGIPALIINTRHYHKVSPFKLRQIAASEKHDAAEYYRVLSAVSNALYAEVASLDIDAQMLYYEGAIEQVGQLFTRTLGKQRQVARDLRGLFLNKMISQVATEASLEADLKHIVITKLLPFAQTGVAQKPFAPITFRGGIQEVIYTDDPSSVVTRETLQVLPSFKEEQARTEAAIYREVSRQRRDDSNSPETEKARITANGSETPHQRLSHLLGQMKGETPIDIEAWATGLKELHEIIMHAGGKSPLLEAHETLSSDLSFAYYLTTGHIRSVELRDAPLEEEKLRKSSQALETVRTYFSAIHAVLGEAAPSLNFTCESALSFNLRFELAKLAEAQGERL